MADRTIRYLKLDTLRGNPENPKAHDGAQIAQSLDRFGLVEPQTMDGRTGLLVAGHGRLDELRAKQDAGEDPPEGVRKRGSKWYVPVVHGWSSVDDEEALAYLVASNESTIAGGWEVPRLVSALDQVRTTDLGLLGTGFSTDRLDALIAEIRPDDPEPDPTPGGGGAGDEHQAPPARVAPGEVWQLGPHRLMCGDARDASHVEHLLAGVPVHVGFTSPPYAERRKYDEASGFVPIHPDAYVEWFAPVAANVAAHLAPDGSWFVNIKAGADGLNTELYVLDLVLAHARDWGWYFATELCWERGGMPQQVTRRFKNGFEPIFQFARAPWKFRPDAVRHASDAAIRPAGPGVGNTSWVDPASNFSHQGEVGAEWFRGRVEEGLAYPSNRLPTFAGTHEATGHMAAFPVGLPAWFLRAYSDPGDTMFDPFVGSGSSILAAEQEGRIGYGMELSPLYCDIVLDRWERHGGDPAEKVDTP